MSQGAETWDAKKQDCKLDAAAHQKSSGGCTANPEHEVAPLFVRSLFRGTASPVPDTKPEPFSHLPVSASVTWPE